MLKVKNRIVIYKIYKKFICSMLVVSLFISIVSCSDGSKKTLQNDSTTEKSTSISTEIEFDAEKFNPNLEAVDMMGTTFTILSNNWGDSDNFSMAKNIIAEEITGESLNDAIYNRNIAVKSKFNCEIAENNAPTVADSENYLTKSIMSGDGTYDIYFVRLQQYLPLAADNMIMDITNVPGVNWSNPWWDQNSYSALSIDNRHFAVSTDITTVDNDATSAMVFNKQMAENYKLGDIYELVKNGKWTFDVLREMIQNVSNDINGDSKMTDVDVYGLYHERDTLIAFLSGAGYSIATKNENDIPFFMYDNENVISTLNKIADILYDENHSFNAMDWEGGEEDFNIVKERNFSNNLALFMWVRLDNVHHLRNMDTDFGILPDPKYDEAQKEYCSLVNPWTSVAMTIPLAADENKLSFLGMFLDEWGYQSFKLVIPEYYDVALCGKISRDEESSEMLDIIFGNRTYDIGAIGKFGGVESFVRMVMDKNNDWVSYFAKIDTQAKTSLEQIVEKIRILN